MKVDTAHGLLEADGVVRWRRDQLTAVGFEPADAACLAGDTRWDLHALIELVERGCPPGLAIRILAPLERTLTS